MLYVLAFPEFDPAVSASLARFRATHEPERARLVPAHITLVFGLTGVDPGQLSEICENTLAGLGRVRISFARAEIDYDPFEQRHKLLLICEQGQDAIKALHRQLYLGPHGRQLDPKHPYRPHMTVATHRDRDAIAALDPARIASFPLEGVVETVALVSFEGGRLDTLRTFPLGA